MREFREWASGALAPLATVSATASTADLEVVSRMLGDATVVALGEDIHCAAEPLEFRNRLFRYLVEKEGFTAIALESGIVEGRVVHDYVRSGDGDIDAVLTQGLSWTFDCLPQNRTLIEWLRDYNARAGAERQVNFYAFDVPGSPGNTSARRGVDTALIEALAYVRRVDPIAGRTFDARVGPLLPNVRFDRRRHPDAPGYDRLRQTERDTLTAVINDVICSLENKEAHYVAASTARDYEWGYRAAIGARQIDNYLRALPLDWRPMGASEPWSDEQLAIVTAQGNVRDRAQADNLDWIIRREGAAGKICVFAHWAHLISTPILVSCPGGAQHEARVAGTYLAPRLGKRLLLIGNVIGHGEVACGDYRQNIERLAPDSFVGAAGQVGSPLYLLDLRKAPESVVRWMQQDDRSLRGAADTTWAARRGFDVLFYIDSVTPACAGDSIVRSA